MKKLAHILLSVIILIQQSSWMIKSYQAFAATLGTAMLSYAYASEVNDARNRAASLFNNTRQGMNTGKAVDSEGNEITFGMSGRNAKNFTGLGNDGAEISENNTGNFDGNVSSEKELVDADYEQKLKLNQQADSMNYSDGDSSNNSQFGAARAFRSLQWNQVNNGSVTPAGQALIGRLTGGKALEDGTSLNDLIAANAPNISCETKREIKDVSGDAFIYEEQSCTKLSEEKYVKTGCEITREVYKDANGLLKEKIEDSPVGCYLGSVSPVSVPVTQGDGSQGNFIAKAGSADLASKKIKYGKIDVDSIACLVTAPTLQIPNQKTGKQEVIESAKHGHLLTPLYPADNPSAGICTRAKIDNFYADLSDAPACNFFPDAASCQPGAFDLGDYKIDPRVLSWREFAKTTPTDCEQRSLKNPSCLDDPSVPCEYDAIHFTENLDVKCEFKGTTCENSEVFQKYDDNLTCQRTKYKYSCSMPNPYQDKISTTTTVCEPEDARKDGENVNTYSEQSRTCQTFEPVKAINTKCEFGYVPANKENEPVTIQLDNIALPVSEYQKSETVDNVKSELSLNTKGTTASLISGSSVDIAIDTDAPSKISKIYIEIFGNSSLESDLSPGQLQNLAQFDFRSLEINGKPVRDLSPDEGVDNPMVLKEYRIDTGTVRYSGGPYPSSQDWINEEFEYGGEIVKILPGVKNGSGAIDRSNYSNWHAPKESIIPNGYNFHIKPVCRWSYPSWYHRNSIALYNLSQDGNVENGAIPPNGSYQSPFVANARHYNHSSDLHYNGGCFASAYLKKNEPEFDQLLSKENGALVVKNTNDSKFSLEGRYLKQKSRVLKTVVELDMKNSDLVRGLVKSGKNVFSVNYDGQPNRINSIVVKVGLEDAFNDFDLQESPQGCFSNLYDVNVDSDISSQFNIPTGKYNGMVYDAKTKLFANTSNATFQDAVCLEYKDKDELIPNTEFTYGDTFIGSAVIAKKGVPDGKVCIKARSDNFFVDASDKDACNFLSCSDSAYEYFDKDGNGFNAEGMPWYQFAQSVPSQCEKYSQNDYCSYKDFSCSDSTFAEGEYCSTYDKEYTCLVENGSLDVKTHKKAISHCVPEQVTDEKGIMTTVYNCPSGQTIETDMQSFGRVATKLSLPQHIQSDNKCLSADSPESCSVFTGNFYLCRSKTFYGFGGNCCRYSINASYLDYIEAIYVIADNKYVQDSVSAAYGMVKDTAIGGDVFGAIENVWGSASGYAEAGWEYLSDKATATYEAIKKPFVDFGNSVRDLFTTKAQETVAAQTVSGTSITYAPTKDLGVIGGLQNDMYNYMYDGLNYMSEGLGDQVFQHATDAAGELLSDQGGTKILELTPGANTAFTYLTYVYYAYVIANLVISLLSQCRRSEMEFQEKAGMKVCTQVLGSFCSADSWFGCQERSQGYCCYSSMLSRIVNEQGYRQLGKSLLGSGCSGFRIEELGQLDWGKMNLSEWTNALMRTSMMKPSDANINSKLNMSSMTGKTSSIMGKDRNLQDKVDERYIPTEETLDAVERDMENGKAMTVSKSGDGFVISKGEAPYTEVAAQGGNEVYATNEFESSSEKCNIGVSGQKKQSFLRVKVENGLFAHRLVLYPSCQNGRAVPSGGSCYTPMDTGWTYGNTEGVVIKPDGSFSYEPPASMNRTINTGRKQWVWGSDDDGNLSGEWKYIYQTLKTSSCSGQLLSGLAGDLGVSNSVDNLKHSREGQIEKCDFGLEAKIENSRLWIDLEGNGKWQYADGDYPEFNHASGYSCAKGKQRNLSQYQNSTTTKLLGIDYDFKPLGYHKFQVDRFEVIGVNSYKLVRYWEDDDSHSYWTCSPSVKYGTKHSCVIDLSDANTDDVNGEQTIYQNKQVFGNCNIKVGGISFDFDHKGYIAGNRSINLEAFVDGQRISLSKSDFTAKNKIETSAQLVINPAAMVDSPVKQKIIENPEAEVSVYAYEDKMMTRVNYNGEVQTCSSALY